MEKHLYHQMADVEETHWWFAGRRSILASLLRRLDLPPGAKILEAGCGTGGNLAMLARFGDVCAMEYDRTAAALASARGIGRVLPGKLPDEIPFPDERFDLIVLFDVMEHLEDDEAGLNALCALLRDGGHLMVTVPAFPFLWSRHDIVHHHFRRYLRPGLRDLLERSGLEVRFISYFNTLLFPLVVAVRLVGKMLKLAESDDVGSPHPLANRGLAAILGAERFLMAAAPLPFGVSLAAVCTRKDPEAGGADAGKGTP